MVIPRRSAYPKGRTDNFGAVGDDTRSRVFTSPASPGGPAGHRCVLPRLLADHELAEPASPTAGARRSRSDGRQVGQCHWIEGMLRLPRLRRDRLGGPMLRGQALFLTIIGSVVAAVIALILVNSGLPPKVASSPAPSISASASSPAGESAPVVIPKTSSTSSFSYLSALVPSGNLGELVNPGPVKIDGSIYPKSISFYCNVGDPTAFPAYKLDHNARRFQATIGLGAKFPPHFAAGVILVGNGHTLRTLTISGIRPKTIDVNVTGVHTLQLECFGSGQSSSAGWAISVAWGNARVVERH
jgi:hypothetical protein